MKSALVTVFISAVAICGCNRNNTATLNAEIKTLQSEAVSMGFPLGISPPSPEHDRWDAIVSDPLLRAAGTSPLFSVQIGEMGNPSPREAIKPYLALIQKITEAAALQAPPPKGGEYPAALLLSISARASAQTDGRPAGILKLEPLVQMICRQNQIPYALNQLRSLSYVRVLRMALQAMFDRGPLTSADRAALKQLATQFAAPPSPSDVFWHEAMGQDWHLVNDSFDTPRPGLTAEERRKAWSSPDARPLARVYLWRHTVEVLKILQGVKSIQTYSDEIRQSNMRLSNEPSLFAQWVSGRMSRTEEWFHAMVEVRVVADILAVLGAGSEGKRAVTDRFSGRPLVYRADAGTAVLYSVGEDFIDDKGGLSVQRLDAPPVTTDLGFRIVLAGG